MSRRSTYSFPQAPLFVIETEVQGSERQENMLLHHICPGLSVTYLEFLHIPSKYCSFWCRKFPPLGFLLNFADTIPGSVEISLCAVCGLARSSHSWVGGRHEVAVKVEMNFRAQGPLISTPNHSLNPNSVSALMMRIKLGRKRIYPVQIGQMYGRIKPSIILNLLHARANIPTADCKDVNFPETCVPKSL